jgi:hypothetical protein
MKAEAHEESILRVAQVDRCCRSSPVPRKAKRAGEPEAAKSKLSARRTTQDCENTDQRLAPASLLHSGQAFFRGQGAALAAYNRPFLLIFCWARVGLRVDLRSDKRWEMGIQDGEAGS